MPGGGAHLRGIARLVDHIMEVGSGTLGAVPLQLCKQLRPAGLDADPPPPEGLLQGQRV